MYNCITLRACSSKGQIVIWGRIVSASGQIFRSDFRPQDEIFRPGMPFRPLDEQAPSLKKSKQAFFRVFSFVNVHSGPIHLKDEIFRPYGENLT